MGSSKGKGTRSQPAKKNGTRKNGTQRKHAQIERSRGQGNSKPNKASPRVRDAKKAYRSRGQGGHSTPGHLAAFFNKYPGIRYSPFKPICAQFYQMCDSFKWAREDPERESARELFKDAMVKDFNRIYGTDKDNVESWRALCRACGVTPAHNDLAGCRDVVMKTHVNIVDLLERKRDGQPVRKFSSEKALSQHTIKTGRYFPQQNAHAGGLLRFLLRHILNPS